MRVHFILGVCILLHVHVKIILLHKGCSIEIHCMASFTTAVYMASFNVGKNAWKLTSILWKNNIICCTSKLFRCRNNMN
jgi:hypothetical protein